MRYQAPTSKLFIANRKRLISKLPAGAAVILVGNNLVQRSRDAHFAFRQDSSFYWATGIDEPGYLFWLSGTDEILIKPTLTDIQKLWQGGEVSDVELTRITGIKNTISEAEFWPHLSSVKNIYFDLDKNSAQPQRYQIHRRLKRAFPEAEFSDIRPMLAELRSIKSKKEIELIKRAIAVTRAGLNFARSATKPGKKEFELEAVLEAEFKLLGGRTSFSSIVAAGKNACTIHYEGNDSELTSGDLVLLDVGAEYANYAADVSRTWPVDGQFSKRQLEVYKAVRSVQKAATLLMIPGQTFRQFETEVRDMMGEELVNLGLIKSKYADEKAHQEAIFKYFPHATTHFLGLDVHDVGRFDQPWETGMVLTCEPGIYIPKEGIGVRLENDILVTDTGAVDLTADIPIEPDEIEALMAKN